MIKDAQPGRDDDERLVEMIAECLREAERLGLTKAAIDLDSAIYKVRKSPSKKSH